MGPSYLHPALRAAPPLRPRLPCATLARMIIDCHVHIVTPEDAELDRLLRAADRAGIERLCVCSLGRVWREFPTADELDVANQDILDACNKRPDRFIGGVYVSADHADASLEMVERHIANGPMRFLKLWVSQFADDSRLDPVIERCVALDVPVLAHTWIKATGNMQRESTWEHVIHLARRHPALKVWMAHACGRWEETGRAVRDYPNIRVDVSGGEPEDGMVECLVRDLGPERVLWGSDAPGRSFAVQMSKVLGADISDDAKRLILGENIREWLDV